jgi:uncharacterized repeat protein (TIGR03943 family)
MGRDTQSVLLLLVGGAAVRICLDDTYLRYVKAWTRPYLIAAGLVLVVLGAVSLWREHAGRRSRAEASAAPAHDDHGPRVAWLLLLPVFAIFLVAPPALGSYAASRGGGEVARPAESEFAPLPAGDPVTTTLTDYATRAIWDDGRSLEGRRIRLVGFVSPRPGGGFYLARMLINCCAADARPIRIGVQGGDVEYPADTWVAITGTYGGMAAEPGNQGGVPTIRAESIERVPEPAEPYEV